MKSFFTWLILSIVVCCVATAISFQGGMAYDGATTMGFPFTFYHHSVGRSMTTNNIEDHISVYWLAMFVNVVITFTVVFLLLRLYKFFRR
jgi:hypothetical protein